MEVVFFSPEDEAKFEQGFKDLKLAERTARRDARRKMYGWSSKLEQLEGATDDTQAFDDNAVRNGNGDSHIDVHEQLVANS
ncbi:hypothetical protein SLE2022_023430 [Rubroshorea leprosula]